MASAESLESGTGAGAPGPDQMMIDSFLATAHRVAPEHRPLLHELAVGVFWPHRGRDLDLMIRLGEGYVATDAIGRAMGSVMHFPAEDEFSFLGMMVVAPRLRSYGTGRWLMRMVMAEAAGCDLRLTATKAGYRLYESEGFEPRGLVRQHQGRARAIHAPDPVPGVEIRKLAPGDAPAIRALDAHAYGASRTAALDVFLGISEGIAAVKDGEVIGYALMRDFGRGKVIGPVVATEDRIAMQMAAPFILANEGKFLRIDTLSDSAVFGAFLAAAGLGVYDTLSEMVLGAQRRAMSGPQIFGMASHSFG
ncbi:GNAT family N-acetyltransferase [Mangrovicoccus sp. HB161399]|uniref:GNAT family N-acetyltransferase n=1 Tax=Mangrovicoccus sp. HB161399 TaxID=2720392 RepID=UPI0015553123|nr:GNAT family N-acetyltransferase [Mangrovicoccus sp. HB161399]